MSERKKLKREAYPLNILHTITKDNIDEIMSFLEVKDISLFRKSSKDVYYGFKISYTEPHQKVITNNWGKIYSSGGIMVIRRILLDDSCVDPSAKDNHLLCWASKNGYLDVVQEVMKDCRVNPSANNNQAIQVASRNGHLNVVRYLMKDGRVDTSAKKNKSIRWASGNGHLTIVSELMKDGRVDPSVKKKYYCASK